MVVFKTNPSVLIFQQPPFKNWLSIHTRMPFANSIFVKLCTLSQSPPFTVLLHLKVNMRFRNSRRFACSFFFFAGVCTRRKIYLKWRYWPASLLPSTSSLHSLWGLIRFLIGRWVVCSHRCRLLALILRVFSMPKFKKIFNKFCT